MNANKNERSVLYMMNTNKTEIVILEGGTTK
jgi:hypothetical protein